MDAISEIKSRIPIEDLVSQYVPLKKVGRHWKALCPFHNERTPSFYVSPERQLAYCFGCHKGGDHFSFIQEIEGLDFRGALELLAERAGVSLPKAVPADHPKKSERDRLILLHERATAYFEDQLWNSHEGEKVLKYLKKRKLTEETIKKSRLGFAPDHLDGLFTWLLRQDFTRDEIISSGLAVAREIVGSTSESGGQCADRFRMRLMFPIRNLAGEVCAFGGRALQDGQEPKYLNSPETPIFHKSGVLYGLSEARAAIRKQHAVILVEGYMDALAVKQVGCEHVVACGGTAMTEDHYRLLRRFTKELILAFDRDAAGIQATQRALELGFAQDDMNIRVAMWESDAKDPDECVRTNPKQFLGAVSHAMAATEYLLASFQKQYDLRTTQGKKDCVDALLPFLQRMKSAVLRDEWMKQCAVVCGIDPATLYDELRRFQGKQRITPASRDPNYETSVQPLQTRNLGEYLIGFLLTYPHFHVAAKQFVTEEDFEDIELQNIYRILTTDYNQLAQKLSEAEQRRADILRMYIESVFEYASSEALKEEMIQTLRAMLKQRFVRQKRSMIAELRTAAEEGEKTRLLDEYQLLLAREEQFLNTVERLWLKS